MAPPISSPRTMPAPVRAGKRLAVSAWTMLGLVLLFACSSGPEEVEVADSLDGARQALEAGQAEQALAVVRAVQEREGAGVESRRLEAASLARLRRFEEALEILGGIPPEAPEARAVALDRVDVLRAAERPKEAHGEIEALLLQPEDDREQALLLYRRGETLATLGEPERAVADFRQVQALAPDLWQARAAEAAVHLAEGQPDLARLVLESDAAALSSHAELAHQRALVAEAQSRPDEALDWYARAVELDPASWPSHLHRGLILEAKGLRAEAFAAYERALASIPAEDLARREALSAKVREMSREAR